MKRIIGQISMNDGEVDGSSNFDGLEDALREGDLAIYKALAEQLNNVPFEERESALNDIHGVSALHEMKADEIQQCLEQIDTILTSKRDLEEASAFNMAEQQSKEYARSKKFLLMFLRCEKFDPEAACQRVFAFFRHKLRLFGPVALCKDITRSDLDTDDLKSLAAGYFQLLPYRDHTGRAQIIYLPRFVQWEKQENMLRAVFYLTMAALKDEETQSKGAVLIVNCLGADAPESVHPTQRDPIVTWKFSQLMQSGLPIKLMGHHVCTSPPSFFCHFFSSITRFIPKGGLARTRFHEGTFLDILQTLSCFGISNIEFALSNSGELKTQKHKELLKMLQKTELCKTTHRQIEVVVIPSQTDVLLGRGKPLQTHPGNLRLGLIAESLLEDYDSSSSRQEKTKLAAETAAKMKSAGVRFLVKQADGMWLIASDKVARERVSNAFRTVRDKIRTTPRLSSSQRANREVADYGHFAATGIQSVQP